MSRQNSVLGIGKIDHTNSSDDIEEQTNDTTSGNITGGNEIADDSVIPPRLTLRRLRFRDSGDSKQADITADGRVVQEQQQQYEVRF
jgi:hypothetical protein